LIAVGTDHSAARHAGPNVVMKFGLIILSAALGVLPSGCGGESHGRRPQPTAQRDGEERGWTVERPPPPAVAVQERPLGVTNQPVLVVRGQPPLAYIAEWPTHVAVVDLGTNQTLARGPVAARTIIRVDAVKGIFFGMELITPGPLAEGHAVGVYFEADSESVIRSETIAPAQATDEAAPPRQTLPTRGAEADQADLQQASPPAPEGADQ
jgi:hypothetical protein